MVNGHKSAVHTDSPDRGASEAGTWLGGAMQCPSSSNFISGRIAILTIFIPTTAVECAVDIIKHYSSQLPNDYL